MGNPLRKFRQFIVNKTTGDNRVMVQCRTLVNRGSITRQTIDGIEHIIVSSATLPDNIVMNGILYTAEEIAATFDSLEGTLAPVEHPTDSDGNFISATNAHAIHKFHAGAFNVNVRQIDGRVHIEKHINVVEAAKSDRGKRLLDRISELETNKKARPIHTSVGVFLTLKMLDKPAVNADGHEYFAVAENMVFDHDAILLDSVAAAQPNQGVGMAVNKGEKHKVQRFNLSDDESLSDRHQAVTLALEESPFEFRWIEELFEDRVIFWSSDDKLFEIPYLVDSEGIATIVGMPLLVERTVTFTPKTNAEGDAMKEIIVNALKAANIETDGLSDEKLIEEYNKLQASQSNDDDGDGDGNGNEGDDSNPQNTAAAAALTKALEPVINRLDKIETNQTSQADAEVDRLAEIVGNSEKYPGLDADAAKKLGLDTLKGMAANCQSAYGLPSLVNNDSGSDDALAAPDKMVA